MTDKQIIIDKINNSIEKEMKQLQDIARQIIGQLEAQLKRKEQECEELKGRLKEMNEVIMTETTRCSLVNSLKTELDQLKTELEQEKNWHKTSDEISKANNEYTAKLKAENEELKEFLSKEPLAIQALQSAYSDYKKRSEVFFDMIGKYKQTLSEIKEIAGHCMKQDICTTCDYSDKCHIEDEYIPTYDVCKLILQKISEVENGKNS